jgi:hypothetical protein
LGITCENYIANFVYRLALCEQPMSRSVGKLVSKLHRQRKARKGVERNIKKLLQI